MGHHSEQGRESMRDAAHRHVKYPKSFQLPNHPTKSRPECRAKTMDKAIDKMQKTFRLNPFDKITNLKIVMNYDANATHILSEDLVEIFCRKLCDLKNNIVSTHNFDPQIWSKHVVETFCRTAPHILSKIWHANKSTQCATSTPGPCVRMPAPPPTRPPTDSNLI